MGRRVLQSTSHSARSVIRLQLRLSHAQPERKALRVSLHAVLPPAPRVACVIHNYNSTREQGDPARRNSKPAANQRRAYEAWRSVRWRIKPVNQNSRRPFGTTLLITPTLPRSSPDTAPNPTLNPRRRQSLQPSLACYTRRSLCLSAAYTPRPHSHCLPYHPIDILCPSETLLHPVMGNNELTLPPSRLTKPCIAKRPIDLE